MICIDASPAVHQKAGIGRYAEELLLALQVQAGASARQRYAALYHDAVTAKTTACIDHLTQIRITQPVYPWRLRALLAQVLNSGQDELLAGQTHPPIQLFHATEHLLPRFKQVKTVFTLHDLIFKFFPKYHLPRNWIFLQVAMPLFLRRADAVICVSEHTRRDAERIYHLPDHKTHVIYEGVHPRFNTGLSARVLAEVRARYQLPARYILAVGTIEPRKNLITLFDAMQALLKQHPQHADLHVVVVGKQGWLYDATLQAVAQRGLQERVHFTGWLPDVDLPAVYAQAQAVAMPSVYEGFGLPALEGLACGVPVVCSNASSLPELMGDAAVLLPPLDVAAWVTALHRVLSDADFARNLRAGGPRQAAKFSWGQTAAQTQRVYEGLLK